MYIVHIYNIASDERKKGKKIVIDKRLAINLEEELYIIV